MAVFPEPRQPGMSYWVNEWGVPYLCFQDRRGEWKGLRSKELSPAVTLQPLGSCWLPRGSPAPGLISGYCSVRAGRDRQCLLPGEANGKPASVSWGSADHHISPARVPSPSADPRFICPLLQKLGCPQAASPLGPKDMMQLLPVQRRLGWLPALLSFHFICQPRAFPCFCLLKLKARNVDLEYRCFLICYSRSPVLVHIPASCSPIFSLPFPWPPCSLAASKQNLGFFSWDLVQAVGALLVCPLYSRVPRHLFRLWPSGRLEETFPESCAEWRGLQPLNLGAAAPHLVPLSSDKHFLRICCLPGIGLLGSVLLDRGGTLVMSVLHRNPSICVWGTLCDSSTKHSGTTG